LPDAPSQWRRHVEVLRKRAASAKLPRELRYRVSRRTLNAADYGVAQKRARVFIVALRDDLEVTWQGAERSHSEEALMHAQWVTGEYWARHRLPSPPIPYRFQKRVSKLAKKGVPDDQPWLTVRDALSDLPEPTSSGEETIANHVYQPGARSYPGHTGSPLDEPAKTLKAGVHGVPGGENMLRYPDGSVRYFTVREAARLQAFPDSYQIKGAWGEAFRQLGNAVPVKLAEAVARSVRDLVLERSRTGTDVVVEYSCLPVSA
jgi:DNA (cytosine-5)-methyltransferase 1